jgi:hypothetical protein
MQPPHLQRSNASKGNTWNAFGPSAAKATTSAAHPRTALAAWIYSLIAANRGDCARRHVARAPQLARLDYVGQFERGSSGP